MMINSLVWAQLRLCKDKARKTGKSYGLGSLQCSELVLILFELIAECIRSEDCSFLIILQGQDLSLLNHDFSEVEVTLEMLLS